MSDLVRAVVMNGPGDVEVRRFPLPRPEPGAVLMRVTLAGICGTDGHTFRGETSQYAGTEHAREIPFPVICGHENVGVVVETGGEVPAEDGAPLEPGDRIVPGANVACGTCPACRAGLRYYLCERLQDYGNSFSCATPPHLFGGWAEYLYLLPGSRLFRVPDAVPDHVAVLTEPMAVTHGVDTAVELLRRGGSRGPLRAAVIGVGPLGVCHLLKAASLGAGELVAIDRLSGRLDAARSLGATLTLDASVTDPADRRAAAWAAMGGVGPDLVVDCSGSATTLPEALRLVRPGGVVVEAGAFVDVGDVTINPAADICVRDVTLIGVGGERAEDYPAALALMASSDLGFDRIVTHRFPLEDAHAAIDLAGRDGSIKVVFEPSRSDREAGAV
jgi:threonine dehydrogenase-like Zn-dependent dehydrogenase